MLIARELVEQAEQKTGLSDFGGETFREGLERLTDSLRAEAELNELGEHILGLRLTSALENRLRVEDTIRSHPAIEDEVVEGPIVILGLPRTGTTATSQLLALDPAVRSLRLWESGDPVPPPEQATEDTDPRIAEAAQGLEMMYATFPRMASLHIQTPTGPTECQDLLGMEFRTAHFDGMAHVPSYTDWVVQCDMTPAYRYHRRVLQLLQWHCPPNLWHLKTPVHMLSLDALCGAYPDAMFLWNHRDPALVLGSVCSLIEYTQSWVSDRKDPVGLGAEQVELWTEALRRAMEYRDKVGEERFADISWADLQSDPVSELGRAYQKLGLDFSAEAQRRMEEWRAANPPGARGAHEFSLDDFGLSADLVRERFGFYLDRFGLRAQ
jgi:Sulfotransferase family